MISKSASTYGEIEKEETTIEIDSDSNKKYRSALEGVRPYLQDFHSARAKVLQYQSQKQSTRRKRDARSQEVPPLSINERKSLLEAYKKFEILDREKIGLKERLSKVDRSIQENFSKLIGKPKSADLTHTLNRIGWTQSKKIQIIRPFYKGERKVTPNRANSFNWKSWDQNPYKEFFNSSEDFYQLVDGVNKAKKEYENYMASKRGISTLAMFCGSPCQRSIFREKANFQKRVDSAESSVDMVVASKILQWMDLISIKHP